VHRLVEAANKTALSRGMQGFQVSAAKHINRAYSDQRGLERRRRGNVFTDRFHEEVIRTPRQARHTLSYVLNNWRKPARIAEGWLKHRRIGFGEVPSSPPERRTKTDASDAFA
jgi:hypothetical protein